MLIRISISEFFYGLGESDTDFFDKSSTVWQTRTPNSSVVKIGYGIREMVSDEDIIQYIRHPDLHFIQKRY